MDSFVVSLVPFKEEKEVVLAEGTYGSIIVLPHQKENVVGKRFKRLNPNYWIGVLREIGALRCLRHPGIIHPRGMIIEVPTDQEATLNNTRLTLVLPRGRGDLRGWMKNEYQEKLVPALFYQIVHAVSHVHARSFLHRDITPRNIILFGEKDQIPQCRLGDFGLSRYRVQLDNKSEEYSIGVMTIWYRPPEILLSDVKSANGHPYDYSADIWSLGVLFYELLTGNPPFKSLNEREILAEIKKSFHSDGKFILPKDLPPLAGDLLSNLLCWDPVNRMTAQEILEHPYFRQEIVTETIRLYFLPKKPEWAGREIYRPLLSKNHFVDRLYFIGQVLDVSNATVELAVSLFVRIFLRPNVDQLTNYAMACFYLAYELMELTYLPVTDLPKIAPSFGLGYSKELFDSALWDILLTLEFQVYPVRRER